MGLQFHTRRNIAIRCEKREPFKIGNLSAKLYKNDDYVQWGRLPAMWKEELIYTLSAQKNTYVFYSWETPIGWTNGDEWVIPDVWYSNITTHHQSVLKVATMPNSPYLQLS